MALYSDPKIKLKTDWDDYGEEKEKKETNWIRNKSTGRKSVKEVEKVLRPDSPSYYL